MANGGQNQGSYSDPLFLSNSDHPGSQLVVTPFDGSDFLSWSHGVKLALGAKYKLGFIDGSCKRPEVEGDDLARWIRSDYMVRCWITNSMTKSISSGFRYVSSAQELWDELNERYAQSNAPLVFQLRRSLSNLRQDNLSVSDYYGKLKLLWDEIRSLDPLPECECATRKACVCDLSRKLIAADSKNKMMDFLMGLGDSYENVRSQILGMDPVPTVNKAFYMVQQIERQKQVTGVSGSSQNSELSALAAGRQQGRMTKEEYRKMKQEKMDRFCDFCKQKGHLREACFKLTGFPDWYKGNKTQSGSQGPQEYKPRANAAQQDNPLEFSETQDKNASNVSKEKSETVVDSTLISTICQEVLRAMKGKGQIEFSGANFAGPFN